jgi:UDP-N-acetylmuramate dehydrogenase
VRKGSALTDYAPDSWDPPVDAAALSAVLGRLEASGLEVRRDHPLGSATTLGVGGPAHAYVLLDDLVAAQTFGQALAGTTADEVPVLVLGKGSNTLVSDLGFDGLVVRLGAGHKWLRRDGVEVEAGAAEAMPALASWVAREGLAGLEFAAGIPATVGGSIRMNAGAHGGDTATRLLAVRAVRPGDGTVVTLGPDDLHFGYRRSRLPPRHVFVSARWRLAVDDPAVIRARLDELRAWRRATQPLRERNCGSVFTNPLGDSAGRLIEAAGCKGLRIGGAAVSTKHANFITAGPGSSAEDVRAVIATVRHEVVAAGGPLLEPEVRLVGHFPG